MEFTKPATMMALMVVGLMGSLPAQAASVQLVPTSAVSGLDDGDLVTFDLVIDFSGEGGTLGGGLDVLFDSAALDFISVNRAAVGDEDFSRDPDSLSDLLESWAVGDFDGLADSGPVLLGSVQFQVLPAMPDTAEVSVSATTGVGGPWVSGGDFVSLLTPQYNLVQLSRPSPTVFEDGFEDL